MKRAKRLYILLGVLAVVCAVTLVVVQYEEKQEQIRTSGDQILSVETSEVQSLSWETETATLAFHKDENWLYDEDEAFPVDEEHIEELLEQFQDFRAAFVIEEVTDYAQYGLDEPVCTIDLTAGETSYEIQLGAYSTMDSQRYVSIGDGNVYLVEEDPMDQFDVELSDLIDNDEVPAFDQVQSLTVAGTETYEAAYQEENPYTACADDTYFVQKDGAYLALDTDRVEDYLDTLHGLSLTDYVTYNATEEEIQSCGLDDPELTVTVQYTSEGEDGQEESGTFTISVSRDPDELAAAAETDETSEEDEEEEITAYARVGESPILYQISGAQYEALMAASYDDLRHQEVFTGDFEEVTSLEVELEGQTYTITAQGSGDKKTFTYGEEELDIADLQEALEGLTASSFTEESPTEKEEVRLTLTLDNENVQSVEIALYRWDGEQCLAVVDGTPVSLVPRASVVDLIEAINAIVL